MNNDEKKAIISAVSLNILAAFLIFLFNKNAIELGIGILIGVVISMIGIFLSL